MPEARDFAESLEPFPYRCMPYLIDDNGSHSHCSANDTSGGGRPGRLFTGQSTINRVYNAEYRRTRNLHHRLYPCNDLISMFVNLLSSNFYRKRKETACNITSARTSANNFRGGGAKSTVDIRDVNLRKAASVV